MTDCVLVPGDASYPPRLAAVETPPDCLHLRGELPRGPLIAIVGTRHPTSGAERFATELAADLASRGFSVCSGGAIGIDTAAHRGCMRGGAPTLVIAPSSHDRPYPECNGPLFAEVVERGGAVLSSYPPGTPARRHQFFERNAVLAALSSVVVVIETALRGGARNAAKAARTLGRPVLVAPGAPWNPKATGCLHEIQKGATLLTSVKDVLMALGAEERSSPIPCPARAPAENSTPVVGRRGLALDEAQHLVVSAIETGASHLDELCAASGLSVARVQATLLTLTLEGIVVSGPAGRLSLVSR